MGNLKLVEWFLHDCFCITRFPWNNNINWLWQNLLLFVGVGISMAAEQRPNPWHTACMVEQVINRARSNIITPSLPFLLFVVPFAVDSCKHATRIPFSCHNDVQLLESSCHAAMEFCTRHHWRPKNDSSRPVNCKEREQQLVALLMDR